MDNTRGYKPHSVASPGLRGPTLAAEMNRDGAYRQPTPYGTAYGASPGVPGGNYGNYGGNPNHSEVVNGHGAQDQGGPNGYGYYPQGNQYGSTMPYSPKANFQSPHQSPRGFPGGSSSMSMDVSMSGYAHGHQSGYRKPQTNHLFSGPAQQRLPSGQQTPLQRRSNASTPMFAPPQATFRPGGDAGPAKQGKIPTRGEYALLKDSGVDQRRNQGDISSALNTPQGPTHQKSFGFEEDSTSAECVTVFGFPPEDASYVLREFEQYGTIIKKHIEKGGNWMHLQYSTKTEAEKALGKNEEKVLQRRLMIGVCRCKDPGFTQSAVEHPAVQHNILNSPMPKRTPHQAPRSLVHPVTTTGTPQKNAPQQGGGGFIGLAREYVLGW